MDNRNLKVLIIEDDNAIAKLLQTSLKLNNYNNIVAKNGIEGLSLFLIENPDIVLLDLGLPDLDGVEVLKHIREQKSTPVIVISARFQVEDKIKVLDNGADDYITKPFNIDELMARIRVSLRHVAVNENDIDIFEIDNLKVDFTKRRVFATSIRRKMESDTTKPRFIITEVGIGYRFAEH